MVNSYASNELYHWGVKGMKWGIRRYQNKDGSLTAAGQKRYNKEMQKAQNEQRVLANKKRTQEKMDRLESIRKKNAEDREALSGKSKGSSESSGKKSVSEMTDAELSAHNQRLRMEKETLELQSRINQLTPQKVSRGQQFIDKYGVNIAKTLWNDIAKNNINKAIENKLGMKVPESELDKLKKEAETWKAKASIAKDKKNTADDTEKYQKAEERRERERKAAEDDGKNESGNNQQKTKADTQSSSNSQSGKNTSKVGKDSNSNSNTNSNRTDTGSSKNTTDKTTNSSNKPDPSGSSDQYISYYSNYGEKWYRKKSRSARTTTIDMKQAIDSGEIWIMDNVYDRD